MAALPLSAASGDQIVALSACNSSSVSQPFAPWADWSSYELAPGGDFTSSKWTLTGGAQRVSDGGLFAASGVSGSFSLSLPAGAVGESPTTCVNTAYPTIRFFIAGSGAVAVQLVYGNTIIPAGTAVGAGGWLPTSVMLTGSAVTGALSGGTAQVSLLFTALSGDPRVADVFVDPWNRG